MEPLHFKLLLTVWLGIGIVASIIGQALNIYLVTSGKIQKATINLTWMFNGFLLYGIWRWL